ncbi:MAG: diacylglycerol kinase [Thermoleophilia bacterium]
MAREGRRRSTLLESFNYAFQGLIYVFRHQRNMRVHLTIAIAVLLGSLFFDLTRMELVAVLFAITLVLMAEMLNTAIEAAVDLVTSSFDPKAKIAKDVAAGAVLAAAINSLVVAYFVFADKATDPAANVLAGVRRSPAHVTFIAFLVTVLLVIILKAVFGRGLPLSGGLPSGHAALAFSGWAAVTYLVGGQAYGVLASAVALIMATLTAQTRVEAGIHTTLEVVMGAILGILVTTIVFQLWF